MSHWRARLAERCAASCSLRNWQTVCLDRLVEISTGAELGWAEGMGLCEEFWLGATHSSRVYSHEWRPGDLVLIDNIVRTACIC